MMSVIELLRLTIAIYRKNFGLYFGYAAWLLIPTAVVAFLTTTLERDQELIALVGQIVLVILSIWVWIILTLVTAKIIHRDKLNMAELSQSAWQLMLPVILVSLIVGIIEVVGFILLIIPGVIFMVWYAFAALEVILHGKRGMAALKESRELSRGKFWRVLWRLLAGPAILTLVYAIFSLVLISSVEYLTSGTITLFEASPSLAAQLLSSITDTFVLPLFVIYPILLYVDLHEPKQEDKK